VFFLLLLTTSCGFALRGSQLTTQTTVSTQSDEHGSPLLFLLNRRLDERGVLREIGQGDWHVHLERPDWQTRLLSLEGAQRNQLIRLVLHYRVTDRGDKTPFGRRRFEQERVLSVDDNLLTGAQSRTEDLQKSILRNAVEQIVADIYLATASSAQPR